MPDADDYLALDDPALLAQCDAHTYRASGPGGQHRNKVSSAVRLRHRPTGIAVQAEESRSQHENRLRAIQRLRMELACRLRRPVDPASPAVPPVVAECLFTPRRRAPASGEEKPPPATRRLQVGRKDRRFWPVAAFLLDLLDAASGRLADAAAVLGVSSGNLVSLFQNDRHLLAAAQALRKKHKLGPIL